MAQTEVVIVTHNSYRHIGPCLDSVFTTEASAIVVDNASTDETVELIRSRYPSVKIIDAGGNLGYGRAINIGFAETRGDFVVLSNPDVVYLADAIPRMVRFLKEHPDIAITGPQQQFPNGRWQRSYGDLPGIWPGIKDAVGITSVHRWVRRLLWPVSIDRVPKDVPYVDGASLAVRSDVFRDMGGFDETFYFYADESDLCARLSKAGWRVVFYPLAQIVHIRGADSIKLDRSDRFLRHMVQSQTLLASKLLPEWKQKIYAQSQNIQFRRLAITYRFLRLIAPGTRTESLSHKIWMFDRYSEIWREHLSGRAVVT